MSSDDSSMSGYHVDRVPEVYRVDPREKEEEEPQEKEHEQKKKRKGHGYDDHESFVKVDQDSKKEAPMLDVNLPAGERQEAGLESRQRRITGLAADDPIDEDLQVAVQVDPDED